MNRKEQKNIKKSIILLPKNISSDLEIFQIPHPSNNQSKAPLQVFVHDKNIYQIKVQKFSQGCSYEKSKNDFNQTYSYNLEGQPFKSSFLVDELNRDHCYVMEDGEIKYSLKYDLTFSLCGYHYCKNITKSEDDYDEHFKVPTEYPSNFLRIRDLQDHLVDNHSSAWSKIPIELLEFSLKNISECIEEDGDKYFKITCDKITLWLVKKVRKIMCNFPKSLPLPNNLPYDISEYAKIVYSCNLIISLIPQLAYHNLINYDDKEFDIKNAFKELNEYQIKVKQIEKEREIISRAAATAGLSSNLNTVNHGYRVKKSPKHKGQKVAVGKGAIDGFFKKKT